MIFKNKIEEIDTTEIVYSKYTNWEFFKNSTIMITGATGLIGFQTILAILLANEKLNTNIKVLALVRNKKKAKKMFSRFTTNKLKFIVQDILKPIKAKKADFIIHTANTTSSREMTECPVETINSIVEGTKNVLEFSKSNKVKSIVYLSSMEVYGDIPISRKEPLKEEDLGKIDILKPRSSYPVGKRLAESMCSAYAKEYNTPVKIARLAQTIGAGVDYADNRVFAQFARNIVEKKDIVLKTKGETIRSYIYITDCIIALLKMLEKGENGESYNVANPDTTCSIKQMAQMLCSKHENSKLKFELDDKYFPKTTKLNLSIEKLNKVSGWKPVVSLEEAYNRLINSFIYNANIGYKYGKIKKITPAQKLFSIYNEDKYKVINVFGFKIKKDFLTPYIKKVRKQYGIKKNKIVFMNYLGSGYGCNPKYITEELLKRNLPYEIVWISNAPSKDFPKGVRVVPYSPKKTLFELVTAKIWVDNYHKISFIKRGLDKLPEQKYIQTWHGSLGIKKIEKSAECLTKDNTWLNCAVKNSKMTDFWISNSDFESNVYNEAFWDIKEIKKFGHPRNDVFFKDNKGIINRVKTTYDIPENTKILLYAPTFREDEKITHYDIDFDNLKAVLSAKFGGDWTILVRLHSRLEEAFKDYFKNKNNIINATYYPDMQELLVAADVGITDYSSWMFDYMLSKKPVFIYATDIEKYNTERGFYYPLEETPFPIAKDNEELSKNIKDFDDKKYIPKVNKFLAGKGCMEDGHASERVVDLIESMIND